MNANPYGERVNGLLERRAPVLLRIAMLLALTDQTDVVNIAHIDAALAWVKFWVESVRFIFSSVAEEVEAKQTDETAEKIVAFLAGRDSASRWQLSKECFKGHETKERIDAALDELLTSNPPRIATPVKRC